MSQIDWDRENKILNLCYSVKANAFQFYPGVASIPDYWKCVFCYQTTMKEEGANFSAIKHKDWCGYLIANQLTGDE